MSSDMYDEFLPKLFSSSATNYSEMLVCGIVLVCGLTLNTSMNRFAHGDFWHGNPSVYSPEDINPVTLTTFGALLARTMQREERLRSLGYKVITTWESDVND